MKKIAKILILISAIAFAVPKTYAQVSVGVGISAGIAPPALPVYEQPACPVDGYIWQPGYWAYDPDDGYYWVPGVWVAPPDPGYLWTPPYWGFAAGVYGFHPGYWGLSVGFYGGINYGFGYGGFGFYGGRWDHDRFMYNAAVWHVNRTFIRNTYIDRSVIRNNTYNTYNHYSFNGPGGAHARPTRFEEGAMHQHHIPATASQMAHQQVARANRAQFANVNHGHPAAVAMNRVNGHAYTARGHVAPHSAFRANAVNNTTARQQRQHQNMQAQRQHATENRVAQRQRTNENMRTQHQHATEQRMAQQHRVAQQHATEQRQAQRQQATAQRQHATVQRQAQQQRQNMQAQRAQQQQRTQQRQNMQAQHAQQQQRTQPQRAQLQQRPAQQRPNGQRARVK